MVEDVTSVARPLHLTLGSPNLFAANSFSARRQQIESSQLFHYEELTGHTDCIAAMEFYDDGTFLVSGGDDKTVRLWSLNQGHGERNSTQMETKHDGFVSCLAFSP